MGHPAGTVDRDRLVAVCSPIVMPVRAVAALAEPAD